MRVEEPRLTVELVPSAQWGSNLKQALKGKRWDTLRKETYRRAGHRCEVCGGVGQRHPVEAHEVWSYDEGRGVQRLERLVALCPACHEVKHIGRAVKIGRESEAAAHLAAVNGWTLEETRRYLREERARWNRRNDIAWMLDLSVLAQYGIEPPTAAELEAGRVRSAANVHSERRP